MLPNVTLDRVGSRMPATTPEPVNENPAVPFTWFAVTARVTLPLKVPTLGGANVIGTEVEVPALMVSGTGMLLMENPAPLMVAWVTVISVVPLFSRVTTLVWVVPTCVLPKASAEVDGESVGGVTAVAVADREA
jgi:hypothetical protein